MADQRDGGIGWTDHTWNVVRGCSKNSKGCLNCYAEKMAARFCRPGQPYEGLILDGRWSGEARFIPERLQDPLRWMRPRKVFVNSMSDLFHESLEFEDIAKVFEVMAKARQHSFQILTKRPARMRLFFDWLGQGGIGWPLPNVLLGVSVEDQAAAEERIPILAQIPALIRWASIEPLIGPVDLGRRVGLTTLARLLDWVVVGGESKTGARPMHPEWVRALRNTCLEEGVPFFLKSWGEWGARSFDIATGDPVFRMFSSHTHWANKASTWVNGGTCLDMEGRVLEIGRDFAGASYPVAVLHRVGPSRSGRQLDGQVHEAFPELLI